MDDAHAKTVEEVLGYFGTDPDKGLSADQVKRNQEKYGPNGKSKHSFKSYLQISYCNPSDKPLGAGFCVYTYVVFIFYTKM